MSQSVKYPFIYDRGPHDGKTGEVYADNFQPGKPIFVPGTEHTRPYNGAVYVGELVEGRVVYTFKSFISHKNMQGKNE